MTTLHRTGYMYLAGMLGTSLSCTWRCILIGVSKVRAAANFSNDSLQVHFLKPSIAHSLFFHMAISSFYLCWDFSGCEAEYDL